MIKDFIASTVNLIILSVTTDLWGEIVHSLLLSTILCLSGVGSQWQQLQQDNPDVLPRFPAPLVESWDDPRPDETLIILTACSGSTPGSLISWRCPGVSIRCLNHLNWLHSTQKIISIQPWLQHTRSESCVHIVSKHVSSWCCPPSVLFPIAGSVCSVCDFHGQDLRNWSTVFLVTASFDWDLI